MARKSRVEINEDYIKSKFKVGVYLRLSSEDGDNAESDSISNQKRLVEMFISKENDCSIYNYYIDDGYSGTTFQRPAFQNMYNDIVNNVINTVIVKDLSRFGRNYIEVGNYLEQLFPLYNVRFIAINDNIDSFKRPDSINNMIVPFKNILNDEYARDISKKVRTVLMMKARQGDFVAGPAPFGYEKEKSNIHHLVINKKEAEVVKLIFNKALEGWGKVKIVRYLNDNNILCRKEIMRRKKRNISLDDLAITPKYYWCETTIKRLLENEVYIGSVVYNKTGTTSYKSKTQIKRPRSEWIIVENRHEPIISKEDFNKAQEMINSRRTKKKKLKNISIYNGILKCKDCGKSMIKIEDPRCKKYSNYYCMTHQYYSKKCSSHKIKSKDLDSIVLTSIKMYSKLLLNYMEVINNIRESKTSNLINQYTNLIKTYESDICKYKKLKRSIYEDWKLEKITENDFKDISDDYDNNITTLLNEISLYNNKINDNKSKKDLNNVLINKLKRNSKIKIVSKELLEKFVSKIFITKDGNVDIKFNFQDVFIKEVIDI